WFSDLRFCSIPDSALSFLTFISDAIIDWWHKRCQTETTYQLISKTHNCTGCVTGALHAAGLGERPSAACVLAAADVLDWELLEGNRQNPIWG
ncbi:MAG TPA: hypothetical protein VFX11_12115, partial [Candidatus Kapabacteria bacterium]|nr:hypothetical protein [Candidatus Kapabacteria bacterium]